MARIDTSRGAAHDALEAATSSRMTRMERPELKINRACKVELKEIGSFGTPLLVVDDFLERPEEVRSFGLTLRYNTTRDYYPGVGADVSLKGMNETALWVAMRMLQKIMGTRKPPSWLTLNPGGLSKGSFAMYAYDRSNFPKNFSDQHVDAGAWLATVLQLSHDTESRGTAFWQHRPTGLESWFIGDPVQIQLLEASLGLRLTEQIATAVKRMRVQHSNDIQEMINAAQSANPNRRPLSIQEDDNWKLLEFVPAKFNRLVAYPTWQLHSGIDDTNHAVLTTDNARLTLNQFVQFPFPDVRLAPPRKYPPDFVKPVRGLNGA